MVKTLKKRKWCLTYLYGEGQVSAAFKAFALQTKFLDQFDYGKMKNPSFEFLEAYNLDRDDLPAIIFNYVMPYQYNDFDKEDGSAPYLTFIEDEQIYTDMISFIKPYIEDILEDESY